MTVKRRDEIVEADDEDIGGYKKCEKMQRKNIVKGII